MELVFKIFSCLFCNFFSTLCFHLVRKVDFASLTTLAAWDMSFGWVLPTKWEINKYKRICQDSWLLQEEKLREQTMIVLEERLGNDHWDYGKYFLIFESPSSVICKRKKKRWCLFCLARNGITWIIRWKLWVFQFNITEGFYLELSKQGKTCHWKLWVYSH